MLKNKERHIYLYSLAKKPWIIHASFSLVNWNKFIVVGFVCLLPMDLLELSSYKSSVMLHDYKTFSCCIYVFVFVILQKRINKASLNAKWPGRKFLSAPLEIELCENHRQIPQQTDHYSDKWALSASLAGHMRRIPIIIRHNHWLTVHRIGIDQTAQSSSCTC